jgi:hypothetical protein
VLAHSRPAWNQGGSCELIGSRDVDPFIPLHLAPASAGPFLLPRQLPASQSPASVTRSACVSSLPLSQPGMLFRKGALACPQRQPPSAGRNRRASGELAVSRRSPRNFRQDGLEFFRPFRACFCRSVGKGGTNFPIKSSCKPLISGESDGAIIPIAAVSSIRSVFQHYQA